MLLFSLAFLFDFYFFTVAYFVHFLPVLSNSVLAHPYFNFRAVNYHLAVLDFHHSVQFESDIVFLPTAILHGALDGNLVHGKFTGKRVGVLGVYGEYNVVVGLMPLVGFFWIAVGFFHFGSRFLPLVAHRSGTADLIPPSFPVACLAFAARIELQSVVDDRLQ